MEKDQIISSLRRGRGKRKRGGVRPHSFEGKKGYASSFRVHGREKKNTIREKRCEASFLSSFFCAIMKSPFSQQRAEKMGRVFFLLLGGTANLLLIGRGRDPSSRRAAMCDGKVKKRTTSLAREGPFSLREEKENPTPQRLSYLYGKKRGEVLSPKLHLAYHR